MNALPSFALLVAVGGLLLSGLTLALARLLRHRPEPLRYGILLTGVVGMLAVPALVGVGRLCQSALPTAAPQNEVIKITAEMLPALLNRPAADALPAEPEVQAGWGIGIALAAVWLLGTVVGITRLLLALHKQRRALTGLPWCAAFWTDERRARLAQQLGLKRFPAVYMSPAVPMPMVIGIWRPRIVLPEAAPRTWQQPQWEAVLLHEAAHIARGDPWAVLAQRLAIVLFWWCPLVYMLARRLDALRENICDDCALAGCDRLAYAELLVDSAEHFLRLTALPAPLGLLDSARGGLEARVSRLLRKEKPTMTRLSLPGKLLGAVCLVAACLATTAGTALSGGQAAPKKVQIKIIIDGKELDLSDPQLWQHLEAAQKRAAEVREHALKALNVLGGDAKRGQPATLERKELAISPDGKRLAVRDGARVVVVDRATGKIVAEEHAKAGGGRWLVVQDPPAQSRTDPRIEALVKQAEAIKPGSGDAIRKALQGAPKHGSSPHPSNVPLPKAAQEWHLRFGNADTGKKVIIVDIGGKVLKLNVDELHKLSGNSFEFNAKDLQNFIDKAIRVHWERESKSKGGNKDFLYKVVPDRGTAKPASPPPDLEALSRQLDRLNAELNDLRRRLDVDRGRRDPKKK